MASEKTRYLVVDQSLKTVQAAAERAGWVEGESLWDYVDIAYGERTLTFKSPSLAFAAARKCARDSAWGAAQLYEQITRKERPTEADWCDVAMWEVQPGDRVMGKPTNTYCEHA